MNASVTASIWSLEQAEQKLIDELSNDMLGLFCSEINSDLKIVVDGKVFPAHKVVLIIRSTYFKALIYNVFKSTTESQITLTDISANGFEFILKYFYTANVDICGKTYDEVTDILSTAKALCVSTLEYDLCRYLASIISVDNVLKMLNTAIFYDKRYLEQYCIEFIDPRASQVIESDDFVRLDFSTVKRLVERDTFYAPELNIFLAVSRWVHANPDMNAKDILSLIRYVLFTDTEIMSVVIPSGLISPETLERVRWIKEVTCLYALPYRANLIPNVNLIDVTYGARVTHGNKCRRSIGVSANFRVDFITYHRKDPEHYNYVIIKLKELYFANTFSMTLSEWENRRYSFYLELSADGKVWIMFFDSTEYTCRGKIQSSFDRRAIKYIKIVGTSTNIEMFPIKELSIYYSMEPLELHKGILIAKDNVALLKNGAIAYDGNETLLPDVLTDASYFSGDNISKFSEGTNIVVVELPQPFMINSIQFFIEGGLGKEHSYYIETSTNFHEWNKVCDNTKEECTYWQEIRFSDYLNVVYIRIVSTKSKSNKSLHISHFECPISQPRDDYHFLPEPTSTCLFSL